MEWFNIFGLIFVAVIMIPNIVFAIRFRDGFNNRRRYKYAEIAEQAGRFGCFAFMIINLPGLWFGWPSDEAFAAYIIVDAVLVLLYCAVWIVFFNKGGVIKALALSILPSGIFLFSGIISRSVPLTAAALVFAPSHIYISYENAK